MAKNLKQPDAEHEYTPEQVKELARCSEDVLYFTTKYVRVFSEEAKKIIPWEPRPYQVKMLKAFAENRFVIGLTPRQAGKTTCAAIFLLHKAMFQPNSTIAILANKEDAAKNVLQRCKSVYEELPDWLKAGVPCYNKLTIEFDNKSTIFASATSDDALRGWTISVLYLDEFAHVENNVAQAFWASNFATIETGGSMIITSTPKGATNKYAQIWKSAMNRQNQFVPIRVDWWEIPGKDEEWKKRTILNLGSTILFNQEYGNAFIGSQNTLIAQEFLERLMGVKPIESSEDGMLWARWSHPEKAHTYIMSCDVAEGKGLDYTAITVWDCTMIPWRQVYRFRNSFISAPDAAVKIESLAKEYNDAFVIVESNSVGLVVLNILHSCNRVENLMYLQKHAWEAGVKSNKQTRAEAVALLKHSIERGYVEVLDSYTVDELLDFGPKNGKFQGINGNDDLAISMAWAMYFNGTQYFHSLGAGAVEFVDFKTGERSNESLTEVLRNITEVEMASVEREDRTKSLEEEALRQIKQFMPNNPKYDEDAWEFYKELCQ